MQTTCFIQDDWDTELIVSFDATYQPAKVTGPWEHCHPEESELDIWDIRAADTGAEFVITDQETLERIEQACWDHFTEEARRYAH